jgi:hypothetical protein
MMLLDGAAQLLLPVIRVMLTTVCVRAMVGKLRQLECDKRKESFVMTIEITRPETEALIHQCLQSGQFNDIDELLTEALGALQKKAPASPVAASTDAERKLEGRKSLVEVCAMVRGLTDDVDFSRNPSTDRPVEL